MARHSKLVDKGGSTGKVFVCIACPKTCKTSSGISKHYRKRHSATAGEGGSSSESGSSKYGDEEISDEM